MTTEAVAQDLVRLYDAGYGLVILSSFEEARALGVGGAAAQALGVPAYTWSSARGLSPGGDTTVTEIGALLRALHVERPAGLYALLDVDPRALPETERRLLREITAEGPLFRQYLLLLSPTAGIPEELARDATMVVLPPPRTEELSAILDECCQALEVSLPAELAAAAVTSALGLGLEEARRAFRLALRNGGDPTASVLEEKRRLLKRSAALDCFDPAEQAAGMAAVGGMDELKRWLTERQRALSPEARAFGLPAPKGLLMLGVQGCGKSLCAKAVAAQWRLPLARLDLAGVFAGEMAPEATLRQAVATAEAMAPAVLWVDEIEKGFGGAALQEDPRLYRLFGWFITWLAERQSDLFVVATANEVEGLPPELLRKGRFDEVFFVDLPDLRSRQEILAIHLERRGRDSARMPLSGLAQRAEHFSGSELEQVVVAGLHAAFAAGRELEPVDLERALQQAVPLYRTYEERIKALRAWAQDRARPAASNVKLVDYFQRA
jgi:AAA+ superfamily predicted ATPase